MQLRPQSLFPLFANVTSIQGVGPKIGEALAKLGITHVVHLLWHMPTGIIDRRNSPSLASAPPGEIVTLKVRTERHIPSRRSGMPYKVIVSDGTAALELIYFTAKGDYLEKLFPADIEKSVSGKLDLYQGKLTMAHPDYVLPASEISKLQRLEPVYSLTAGLSSRLLYRAIQQALHRLPAIPEWLDPAFKASRSWPSWQDALHRLHSPTTLSDIELNNPARERLAYDELLASQLALFLLRDRYRRAGGLSAKGNNILQSKVLSTLPYRLTGAQERTLKEIQKDMASDKRMLRLLQGDVGSGKTIVAFLALLTSIEAGGQGALLAPTDILARQHFSTLAKLATVAGIRLELLTGKSHSPKVREKILLDLSRGDIDILVGTHAILQSDIVFKDLRLAIIDEQHRFGVDQRLSLAQKGKSVDLLVMTATPIPRTLLMAAYGDIDVSRLDEKPAGRRPIDTRIVPIDRLDDVVSALKRAIASGARVYWVCPLVSESEISDLAAVTERYRELSKDFRVSLVHGKQKISDREKAIRDFAEGRSDILVATTIIEVGIDIPEASVMIIEHAERFGLAQLHQLRGRVGRGAVQSSCLLLYSQPLSEIAKARLAIMRDTEDGFRIAEEDLRLRGGGEILGTRQSGIPDFRIADLSVHADLLSIARDDAKLIAQSSSGPLSGLRGEALRYLLYLFERDAAIQVLRSG